MAVAYIAEYAELMPPSAPGGRGQIAMQPPLAEQTVAIGAEADSAAFNAQTKFVRIHVDAICSIQFGTAPTATTSTMRLAANQTEYFAVPLGANYKVSVITNT